MKRHLTAITLFAAIATANAQQSTILLDLSKAMTPLTFSEENGSWTGTYDDDETSIDSQVFEFVHSSMGEWQTWWGFTASNSTDNARKTDDLKYQWSNMARGGIALNDDGSVKTDEYGAPVTSADMPYLVAYYSPYMAKRPVSMTFAGGASYRPVGTYVNLNTYTYYALIDGSAPARAFNNGDKLELTVHGVASDDSEKEVTVQLASYTNGCLTINRGWQYVDLTDLGSVNEIYFTMSTTDTGAYGANTPLYFCMDKLAVIPDESSAVASVRSDMPAISYNRQSAVVTVSGNSFAALYDVSGAMIMSTDGGSMDLSSLPAGIYIVRSGNAALKIAR